MTSITLTLNSHSSRLRAEYFPPIDISDGDYVCGLIDFQTFNTIPNVDETNNLFHFEVNAEKLPKKNKNAVLPAVPVSENESHIVESVLVIPTGTYEIEHIAKFLTKSLDKVGVKFDLWANKNTLKCELFCNHSVDFSKANSIGSLMGFGEKRLEPGTVHESELPANILKVNVIRIECDVIKGSYINNTPAHTIHEFSPRVSPRYKINEVPNKVIYFPVTVRSISAINISLIDQDNNLINFRGETVTVRIHIKRLK